jgi:YVTN family beta-propeller protein
MMKGKMLLRRLTSTLTLALVALLASLWLFMRAQGAERSGQKEALKQPPEAGLQTGTFFPLEVTPLSFTVALLRDEVLTRTLTVRNVSTSTLTFSLTESPEVPWLEENVLGATLPAGKALAIDLTFNATGLTAGAYATTLVIQTTQPGSNQVIVPATMTVQGLVYLPLILKNFPSPPSPPSTPTAVPSFPCAPQRLTDIPVGNQPRGLAVDEARTRVYAANYAGGSVSIIDGHSNTVIKTVTNFPAISAPTGVAYDPASDTIWVGNTGSTNGLNTYWLTPIDAATFAVGATVPVGQEPWGIAFNPVDKQIYVANLGDDTVSVISPTLNSVVKTVAVGQRPYNLAVHRQTGRVYVANFGAKNVSVLGPGGLFLFNVSLDFGSDEPFGIAVDDVLDNYVYVTTVKSYRIETIDIDNGHQLLPWHEVKRLNDTGAPMRALALNLTLDTADGGHLWTTTSTGDMSDFTQVLLIPKGYRSGFNQPTPDTYDDPSGGGLLSAGVAVNTVIDRAYVSLPASNAVRVFGDRNGACVLPFLTGDKIIVVPKP